ncbi:hypothetical protein PSEUBRA_001624 [Kalmanozyma brasiliensis GHG001]|uniref:Acyltransferase n=1 Tax=Kalmanozyma brasiliensis (strain GHG001) TaxID=1365824 RepID=V5GSJ9_KALBG|nr:uncharacterized protein PSEUBRA_001624 [Kalmanozyma brasiliensis GHG001]EST08902.1 hypothetical protein PSEUBRA_001624 [Kalmanozyma brasiliensis GHG001]
MSEAAAKRLSMLRPLSLPVFVEGAAGIDKSYEPDHDERGYTILKGDARFDVTPKPITENDEADVGRKRKQRISYLEGIRGLVAFQTLLYIFFRIFAPAIVTDRDTDGTFPAEFTRTCPYWMNIVRKALSPLLFNGSFQGNMYVILMGRVAMQTFIERRDGLTLAGPGFRRPFRLILPLAVALALTSVVAALNGFKYAPAMADKLNNPAAHPPKVWASTVEYVNTVVSFVFAPYAYTTSVASTYMPPGGIMWFTSVVFQQTYVITVYAWCLPFTIFRWKNYGLAFFLVISAWMGRWSWYTLTGLAIAEYATVYRQILPKEGIPLNSDKTKFLNPKLIPQIMMVLGLLLKYVWIAIVPSKYYNDYIGHIDLNTGTLNREWDYNNRAYPRWDDWLLATGLLVLVELSPALQKVFSNRALTYFGRLGFSIAMVSGTVMLSVGSILYAHLTESLSWTSPAQITAVLFFTMVPLSILACDVWSRVVDDASIAFARGVFHFFRT